jgi:hypothetical protein
VSEKWVARDLQIVVEAHRHDPMHGDATYTVTSITRGEPDASLFEVPAGYTIQDGPGPNHGFGPGGPDGPRPPRQ